MNITILHLTYLHESFNGQFLLSLYQFILDLGNRRRPNYLNSCPLTCMALELSTVPHGHYQDTEFDFFKLSMILNNFLIHFQTLSSD